MVVIAELLQVSALGLKRFGGNSRIAVGTHTWACPADNFYRSIGKRSPGFFQGPLGCIAGQGG
jgi:hypothetical protein